MRAINIEKILIVVLIFFSIVYLGLQLYQYEITASGLRTLMVLLLGVLYCLKVTYKRLLFFLFLVSFAIAEIISFVSWFVPLPEGEVDAYYYAGNISYMISYMFLIFQLLKSMDIKSVFLKLPFHFLILFVLDVFCVWIVTDTARSELNNYEYWLEFVYNAVIMILLSLAVIDYIYRDDKRSMLFLLASISLFFSEVMQLAYFYVSENNLINMLYSFFIVVAFIFFYIQSTLKFSNNIDLELIE